MTKITTACRLAVQVPATLALMPPDQVATYVRGHWNEWQNKWKQIDGERSADELFEVRAGEPIYLIEKNGKYYLVTEGTRIVFAAVA
jgi:hypothetical protein